LVPYISIIIIIIITITTNISWNKHHIQLYSFSNSFLHFPQIFDHLTLKNYNIKKSAAGTTTTKTTTTKTTKTTKQK
jgi:hypothetical protein